MVDEIEDFCEFYWQCAGTLGFALNDLNQLPYHVFDLAGHGGD